MKHRPKFDMAFEQFFETTSWPEVNERIGVVSVESLDRQWMPVAVEDGYLIAKSKDGKAALLGRMCKRDDGKFCIEIVVRTEIESNELRHYEFWHVDPTDEQRHTRRLGEMMRDHIGKFQRDDD
ncbi:Uncharacterised protein [Burkholderia pseudomallei]|nr:Uncharacterised protein [Burkholderia pseudomallei]CAJ4808798.1 Uncharacterised protein [Burkholderia pseudomallei]